MIVIFFKYELVAACIACSMCTNICLDLRDPKGNHSVLQYETLNVAVPVPVTKRGCGRQLHTSLWYIFASNNIELCAYSGIRLIEYQNKHITAFRKVCTLFSWTRSSTCPRNPVFRMRYSLWVAEDQTSQP